MNKKRGIEKKDMLIVAGILVVLLIVGSIWDYSISSALYNPTNLFGVILATYGESPAIIGFFVGGVLLFMGRNRQKKGILVMQVILGFIFMIMGTAMAVFLPMMHMELPVAVMIIIGLAIMAIAGFVIIKISKNADPKRMIQIATVILLVVFLEMLLINVVKIMCARPRMRLIAANEDAYFHSWWNPGTALKEKMMAMGIASEEFKSFPSGHTANVATLIMLCLLPQLNPKLENKNRILFYVGVAWALLVAFSRIIMGAHFLTDVTMGFAVTYCLIIIAVYFYEKRLQKTG